MYKIKIHRFKSEPPITPFSPHWDFILTETKIEDVDFSKLANFILNLEKEMKEKYHFDKTYSDGYTGLGKDSLTARFTEYNLLNLENEQITQLKKHILDFHNAFLEALRLPLPKELYVRCWANVMRKGEQIKPHIHGIKPETYLGGHICVKCNKTKTHYMNPINTINEPIHYSSENEVGKFTLFQNFIPHFTDVQTEDDTRITIAFDLMTIPRVYTSPFGNEYKFLKLI
jgi:hypothetical protein